MFDTPLNLNFEGVCRGTPLKVIRTERTMKTLKVTLAALSLLGACTLNATPLVVNAEAVGQSSLRFLEQLDDQMPGFVRGLSYQKPTEFNALQMAVMLNQSANIEKKLDVLIAEMRETNRLLNAKK